MAWIDFLDRYLRLNGIEEADELLVPVALHVAAEDGTVEDVESSEQRGRTVAFVVVGHRSGTARLDRQTGLGAVERLDLALLINREDDGMGWWRTNASHSPRDRHRGRQYRAALSTNCGSVESLNCFTLCNCRPCARQMRWTELALSAKMVFRACD
jgi:hypothetical protein